jgi:outer membrane beta-barrel protein
MPFKAFFISLLAGACALPALAQERKPDSTANDQVIVPQVERRDVALPRVPSRDFAVGLLAGTYATKNFGTAPVTGLRLGYHITEDVFVEAAFGRSKVSDQTYRLILPGGIFPQPTQNLSYANVSAGVNVLTGEAFFGSRTAKAFQGYLLAGIGSTRFAEQKRQTVNVGFGLRVLLSDRFALQADVRDHVFSLDLLGQRQSTQNLEATAGLTVFF